MFYFKRIFFITVVTLLAGCTSNPTSNKNIDSAVTTTTQQNLVSMINTGNYQSVGQQHDKTVRLVLNNGQVLQAKEPKIDDVLQVIRNCSECSGKPFLTEQRENHNTDGYQKKRGYWHYSWY